MGDGTHSTGHYRPIRGCQPALLDHTGRFCITFNGEIYNFRELRQNLLQRGVTLRTDSDTEVLIECIALLGLDETLRRVRGMFSFVVRDELTQMVRAVRDQFGQKPLYYSANGRSIVISSDIRALLPSTDRRAPAVDAYRTYLCTRGIVGKGQTFFEGVKALPAGCILRVTGNESQLIEYFHVADLLCDGLSDELSSYGDTELKDRLHELLVQAVRRHLVSDVPVGVLLSGGIDSSLIFWLASELSEDLSCFTKSSPGIEEIPLNIVPDLVRRRPRNWHVNIEKPAEYISGLCDFIENSSCPSRWGGGPPMHNLCKLARRNGVIVLLGGDGVDEYFAGYREHEDLFLGRSNVGMTGLLGSVGHRRPEWAEAYLAEHRDWEVRLTEKLTWMIDDDKLHQAVTLAHDTGAFLQACNLPHSDSYSMMASVELRNPLIDLDLVQYCLNLPVRLRFAHGSDRPRKFLFRQLARSLMGESVDVEKEGTRNYSKRVSRPEYWRLGDFVVPDIVGDDTIISEAMTDWRLLFRLINLEIFHRTHMDGSTDLATELFVPFGHSDLR